MFDTLQKQNATWGAYRDIMNPALMYLSGIWFLNAGDYMDAETYLKRAVGMTPKNSFIATDLKLAEKNQNQIIQPGFSLNLGLHQCCAKKQYLCR